MKLLEYNDYELLYLINRRSDLALEILFEKYKLLILKKLRNYKLDILTKEDVVQDCMIEMNKSLNKYNESLNILFITYVDTIFQRKINRFMMKVYKEKKFFSYITYEDEQCMHESETFYNTYLEDMITKVQLEEIRMKLNKLEKDVLYEIMLEKKSINSFCIKHNMKQKKVYNVIQQIRKKCSTIINGINS